MYGSDGKESACNAGDLGSILGSIRSLGEENSYPTPVFWPEEFQGLYSPWGYKELDMTKQLSFHFTSALLKLTAEYVLFLFRKLTLNSHWKDCC